MPNPESCRYAESHEWVSLEGDEAVVGLSDHAQKEITDVVFVELPKVGRQVAKGEALAVVESVKAAFDIYAPIAGEVASINEELTQNPALINDSPFDKGWLYRLKAADPKEADALMDHARYQEFLKTAAQ
ncbi:MAG: glycine cleavage system protein GcvH [Elusimicrobiota bacterium]